MTFGELDEALRSELMETPDTRAGGDPYGRQRAILSAANEIAQRTDCLADFRTTNLVAGQALYCLPDVYRVKAVSLTDDTGYRFAPGVVNIRYANERLGWDWQQQPATANPGFIVALGVNRVQLHPPPLNNRAGALSLFGFCKPGQFWQYAADPDTGEVVPVPLDDSHECPLPSWAHDAVKEQALFLRARTDDRAEIQARVAGYMTRARAMVGAVGRDTAIHHSRMDTEGTGFFGAWF